MGVVPRSTLADIRVVDCDELEIVHFVGGGDISADDGWEVAGQRFSSRLIVGTGKYKSFEQNAAAVEASGAEIVTVEVRRVNISDPKAPRSEEHTSEHQSLMRISYAGFCVNKQKNETQYNNNRA